MKKYILVILTTIFINQIFAIGGFGLYGDYDLMSHNGSNNSFDAGLLQLNADPFDNAYGGGFYLYIDALPFIDVEVNAEIAGNTTTTTFSLNEIQNFSTDLLPWARSSMYVTARKKIFGLSIPFLAKAKLYAGAGMNSHSVTPEYTIDLLTDAFDTDDITDIFNLMDGNVSSITTLANHVTENMNKINGFHVQTGVQAKLLMFDMFLNARYTLAKDVIPGKSGFPSVWLGVGYGI
ncbi:MAG: hypothetical protein H8E60_10285 [Candidatus Marinimicrobia bacterium]|nr:hypothetical protein [Candidatus Neomarinimicrobiota bacterium]